MVSFEQDQFLGNSVVTTAEDMGDNATRGLTFMQRLGRMCKVSFIDKRQIGQLSSILKIFDICNLLNSVKRCLHHETIHNSKLMSFHRIMTPSFSEHQQSFSSPRKSFASIIKHSLETLLNFLISTYFFANILMITMRWERSRSLKRFGGHYGDPASLSIESFSSKTYGIFFILLSISTTGSCTVTVLSSEHTSINPSCTTMKQSSFRNANVNQSASTSNFSGGVSTVVKRTAIMLSKSPSLCQKKSDATYRATTDRAGLVVINSKTSITSSSSYLAEHITCLPSPSFYYRHSRLERDNSTRQIYPTMSLFTIRNEESYYSHSVDESKAATHDQIPQTDSRNLIVSEVSSNQSYTLASVFTWPSSRFTRMSASSPAFIASSSKGLLNTTTLRTIHVDSVNQMVSSLAKLSLSIFSLPSLSPTRSPQASKKMQLRTIESSLHSSLTFSLSSVLTSPAIFSELRPSILASMLSSQSFTLAPVFTWPSSRFTRMRASSPAFVASSSQVLLNITALSTIHVDSVNQMVSSLAKLSLSIFSLPSLSSTRSPQASKKMQLRTIESSLHSSLTFSLSSVLTSPAIFSELRPSILASMLSSQSFTLAPVFTWPSSRFTRMRASSPAFVASSSQVLLNITALSTIHVDSVNQMVSSLAKLSLSIFSLPSLSSTRSPQASKKMQLRTIESSLHSSLTFSLSSVLTSPAIFSELRPSILASMLSSQSFTLAPVFTWPSSRFTRMRASSPAFVASSSQVLLNITTLSTIHVDSVNQMVSSLAKLSLSIFSLPSLSPTRSPQASKKMQLRTIESSLHSSLTSSLSSVLTSQATFSELRPSLLASMLLPSMSVASSLSPGSSPFATSQFSVSQSSSFSRNALSSVIIISSMSSVIPAESVALRTKPGLSATLSLFSAISSQSSPQSTPRLVSYGRSETIYLSSQTIQNNKANMTSAKISPKTQTNSVSSSIIPHQPIVPNDTRILMLNFSLLNEVFHSDLSNESSMRRMNLSQRVHFTLWSLFNTTIEGFKDIRVIQFRNGSVKVDSELRISSHSSVIPDHVRQTLLESNGTNREGFIFDNISVKELCTPGFCMNLGSCQQNENGANCSCIDGFFGIRCLQKASDCGAVNGSYAEWTDFSECSKSCKGGQRSRRRTCTNPPPRNGGKDCNEEGPDVEYADCNSAVQCSISTEILVVVGVSCGVFLVLLILVIFCFLKRRRKQTDQTNGAFGFKDLYNIGNSTTIPLEVIYEDKMMSETSLKSHTNPEFIGDDGSNDIYKAQLLLFLKQAHLIPRDVLHDAQDRRSEKLDSTREMSAMSITSQKTYDRTGLSEQTHMQDDSVTTYPKTASWKILN
ncbi:platelet binding protein GspB-like isoform X2 [Acropora muricata]|uniref:platelet binding protein GspB-like isoform X2 n=1 Tax=Acropora muricata TaxID=159855 RepID=UPI0034E37652